MMTREKFLDDGAKLLGDNCVTLSKNLITQNCNFAERARER